MKLLTELLMASNDEIFPIVSRLFPNGQTDGDNYVYIDNQSPVLLVAHERCAELTRVPQ